jgi:hypothetical protein
MADVRTEHREDQVGEAVDHRGMPIESRRTVHHAEDAHPARDAIEVAELALQAAEDREPDLARDFGRLLERHVGADLAERPCERAVRGGSATASDFSSGHDRCPGRKESSTFDIFDRTYRLPSPRGSA